MPTHVKVLMDAMQEYMGSATVFVAGIVKLLN